MPWAGAPMPKNASKLAAVTPWPMIDPPLFSGIGPVDWVLASPMKMKVFGVAPIWTSAVTVVHSLPSVQLLRPTATLRVK